MSCYKLIVEYDGTRFNGFQRQTATSSEHRPSKQARLDEHGRKKTCGLITIQDCLEQALLSWTGSNSIQQLRLRAAGRTDKGVHATGQVVAIDVPLDIHNEEWQLCRMANTRLPSDIVVTSFQKCAEGFEPRQTAKLKQYTYTLRFRRTTTQENGNKVLPICFGGAHSFRRANDPSCLWNCPWPLDDSNLKQLCSNLAGSHDYSCFVHKEERRRRDNLMDLTGFTVDYLHATGEEAPVVTVKLTLEAKGFGRSMVRNLVGFVVDICRRKLDPASLEEVWSGTDETAAKIHAAPACALCLSKVVY